MVEVFATALHLSSLLDKLWISIVNGTFLTATHMEEQDGKNVTLLTIEKVIVGAPGRRRFPGVADQRTVSSGHVTRFNGHRIYTRKPAGRRLDANLICQSLSIVNDDANLKESCYIMSLYIYVILLIFLHYLLSKNT